jgi:hypothetical protein
MGIRAHQKDSFCMQCKSMSDEKRGNLKGGIPKVTQVKLRIMLTEPINEFIGPGGTYEKYTWKMFQHHMHFKLLGSKFGVRMCYDHFKQNDGVVGLGRMCTISLSVLDTGSVDAMQRVAATKHSVILPLIKLLPCLNNTWMGNDGPVAQS